MNDINTAVRVLNEAAQGDPEAITTLLGHRVKCGNGVLGDHPTIQVKCDVERGYETVGMLGILNGVLEAMTGERVAAQYDGEDKLVGFQVYEKPHG